MGGSHSELGKSKKGRSQNEHEEQIPTRSCKSNLDAFALGSNYYLLNDVIDTDMFFCLWTLVQDRPVCIRQRLL